MTDAADPIPRVTAGDSAAGSGDLMANNIAGLARLYPAVLADGKVDFDVLRQLLGDAVEDGEERYGLTWKGKRRARALALTPSLGTLRPVIADGVEWSNSRNIFVEGDNLEVLKILLKSYKGKIKCIYIDPPYNTGNDFVYPDDYSNSIANYESLTNQRDTDGRATTTNPETNGRYHTDWLNMMYPRIFLAKEFLTEDGLIFISCDDTEAYHVRLLLNEIFGSENLIADLVWKKSYGGGAKVKHVVIHNEHIFCFARNKATLERIELPPDPAARRYYRQRDDKFETRGPYRLQPLATTSNDERENLRYAIPFNGEDIWPEKQWQWEKVRALAALSNDELHIVKSDGVWSVSYKQYLYDENGVERGAKPTSLIDGPYTQQGTSDILEILGNAKIFAFPKPVDLIRGLLAYMHPDQDFITLDFFAGSGTTGHATLAQNAVDSGRRRFILVQLPEPVSKNIASQKAAAEFCDQIGKPRTIAEVTKERLRRAGTRLRTEYPNVQIDTGFRVYKFAASSLKPWQPNPDNLEASLLDAIDNVVPGRTEDDLMVELLLKTGIDLSLPSEARSIAGANVHALGGGVLMVCLADIAEDQAEVLGQGMCDWRAELAPPRATTFYFKDAGFESAATKANLAAIIRQRVGTGVEKLASI